MFYERLLTLCSVRGIRITSLVSELQISSGNLSKWKAGNNPKSETLLKIADYFDVSTDYLLGRTDEKSPGTTEAAPEDPLRSTLLHNFDQLNQEGKERLVETSDDMVSSGKYIKSDPDKLGKAKDA